MTIKLQLKTASLSPEVLNIILDKGTEPPFSHDYQELQHGSYLCRQCGTALFRGDNQFSSHCGWPSFDKEIEAAVKTVPDQDGTRTEIVCAACNAHLGHVFAGEQYTATNLRYCVNGLSLDFVNDQRVTHSNEAIFAAGCFWGVEHYFKQLAGVLKTEVGYSGGTTHEPSYEEICHNNSGHYEVVRVVFNPEIISYQEVCRFFFEIHNFSQANGQGPDLGHQYLSRIFIYDHQQKQTANNTIQALITKGYTVATQVLPVSIFWPAETYHQNYYSKNKQLPYCHRYQAIWSNSSD